MSDYLNCPCGKAIKPTTEGKWRKHTALGLKEVCDFSGTVIQEEQWKRSTSTGATSAPAASPAPSPSDDAKERAEHATSSTPSSSSPQEEAAGTPASTTAPADPALPGVAEYAEGLNTLAATQLAEYKAKVDASLTPFSQPAPVDDAVAVPLFSQPASGRPSEQPAAPMTDLGRELTARLKETFYSYCNRRTKDNRSAQATMGPSEMGSPCSRRLALSLMRQPPCNPGGDNWASFVGTCIHAGLAEMFMWADANTGRFAVETPLEFDSAWVPKGTGDLLDRTLMMFLDHKAMGKWSRNKLKSQGPSQLYRTQIHVYAHGARKRGEKVEHVAIIGWPRDEATLDDLYVWTEPYRPDIVQAAFERVERIGKSIRPKQEALIEQYAKTKAEQGDERTMLKINALVARDFDVADDCRFCPFHLPNARSILDGCNGKR